MGLQVIYYKVTSREHNIRFPRKQYEVTDMRNTLGLRKNLLFAAATIILVLITAFCIAGTVMSKGDMNTAELESYYRQVEKELLGQTREQLEELGFKNSGVTLTKVVDKEGNREYTFKIHHRKIETMSAEERLVLAETLAAGYAAGTSGTAENEVIGKLAGETFANCSFTHEFPAYE